MARITKPCPFCGSDDNHLWVRWGKYDNLFCYIECDVCGAKTKSFGYYSSYEEVTWEDRGAIRAAAAWNRRTSEGGTDHGRQ